MISALISRTLNTRGRTDLSLEHQTFLKGQTVSGLYTPAWHTGWYNLVLLSAGQDSLILLPVPEDLEAGIHGEDGNCQTI